MAIQRHLGEAASELVKQRPIQSTEQSTPLDPQIEAVTIEPPGSVKAGGVSGPASFDEHVLSHPASLGGLEVGQLAQAYRVGSVTPASAKPWRRRAQASQRPQAAPVSSAL